MANTDIGRFVTQILLLTGVGWGGTTLLNVSRLIPTVINQFKTFGAVISLVAQGSAGLGDALKLAGDGVSILSGAATTALPVILGISAAIAAIMVIAPKVSDWYKNITNDVDFANEKLEENSYQLETNKQKLEELYSIPLISRTDEMEEEIIKLEEENKVLQENIDKWNEKARLGALEDLIDKRNYGTVSDLGVYAFRGLGAPYMRAKERLVATEQQAIEVLKERGELQEDFNGTMEEATEITGYAIKSTNDFIYSAEIYYGLLLEKQKGINEQFAETGEVTPELMQAYKDIVDKLKELRDAAEAVPESELDQWLVDFLEEAEKVPNVTGDMYESFGDVNSIVSLLTTGLAIDKEQVESLTASYPVLTSVVRQNADGFYVEIGALSELTKAGNTWTKNMSDSQKRATLAVLQESAKRLKAMIEEAQGLGSAFDSVQFQKLVDAYAAVGGLIRSAQYEVSSGATVTPDPDPDPDGGGSSTKTTDPIKEQSEAFEKLNEVLEHNIFLKEKNGATEEELIELYRQYQNQLNEQANWFREQGEGANSEYIRDLQEQWWNLQGTIEDFEDQITQNQQAAFEERLQISKDYIDDRNFYNDWGADSEIAAWKRVLVWMEEEYYKQGLISFEEYVENRNEILKNIYTAEQEQAEEAQRAAEEAQQQYIEKLEDRQSLYEKFFSYMTDRINEEIEKLQEEYDATEKFWDDKIDAIQEANEELEQQIALEEALDDLARARQNKVMVYKDGRFQYIQDIDEVSEAQANLEKLEREEALRQEVANLEQLKEQALQTIQDQIDGWEDYKKAWSETVDHCVEEQDRWMLEQELNIKLEGELWKERLDNLEEYKNQYQSILNSIVLAQQQANNQLNQMQQQQGQQWGSSSIGGGGGSSDIPYNWTGSGGLSNWNGGTQTNEQGWVMDGKVAAIIDGIGGGAVPVWYDPVSQKVMSSGLKPGDVILTQGGYFQITGGSAGKYNSKPWTPSSSGSSSGGSGGGGGGSSSGDVSSIVGGTGAPPSSSNIKRPSIGRKPNKGNVSKVNKFASGTDSANGGISLVGENGPELRVLGQGDGILPSDVTRNLWSWGITTPSSMINSIFNGLESMGQTISITIQNFNPSLPNVTDGQSFADYMKNNFWREAIQFSKT